MPLVATNSPLHTLPANLDPRQAMFFDGVRYSLDMAGIAYLRLREGLKSIDMCLSERKDATYPMLFLDAWSMVDSVNRLRVLLGNFKGIKNTPDKRVFLDGLAPFLLVRNDIQHLNGAIVSAETGEPALGLLAWFHVDAQEQPSGHIIKGRSRLLVSGQLKDFSHKAINPLGQRIDYIVDLITLTAFGNSVSLSNAYRELQEFSRTFDKNVKAALEGSTTLSGSSGSDLFITTEMVFAPPTTPDNGAGQA